MTMNMGTAAYMAPELTSLIDYATEFPVQCERELGLHQKILPVDADKDTKALALKHAVAIEQFDLSSTPRPTQRPESQVSNGDFSAVHTPRDLAPKVRSSTRFGMIIRELIGSYSFCELIGSYSF